VLPIPLSTPLRNRLQIDFGAAPPCVPSGSLCNLSRRRGTLPIRRISLLSPPPLAPPREKAFCARKKPAGRPSCSRKLPPPIWQRHGAESARGAACGSASTAIGSTTRASCGGSVRPARPPVEPPDLPNRIENDAVEAYSSGMLASVLSPPGQRAVLTIGAMGLSWSTAGIRRVSAVGPANLRRPDRIASFTGKRPTHT